MEGTIVTNPNILSEQSCLELLLLAETHECALIRETAMEMVIDQIPQIMTTAEWINALQSPELVNDLFRQQTCQNGQAADKAHKLDKLGVTALRNRAHEQALDVDGSREVLAKKDDAAASAEN